MPARKKLFFNFSKAVNFARSILKMETLNE